MSRQPAAEQRALADALARLRTAHKAGRTPGAWEAWQEAGAAYWVLRHPELQPWVRGTGGPDMTVPQISARAAALARAHEDLRAGSNFPPDPADECHVRAAWLHETMSGLYDPLDRAIEAARTGGAGGRELLIRFLEADPYCFGSGYAKAECIRYPGRLPQDEDARRRLREVVVAAVERPFRRETRRYAVLARLEDSVDLRRRLRERLAGPAPRAIRARWMLELLGERVPQAADPRGDAIRAHWRERGLG